MKRDPNLDLIRCTAVIFVLCVHGISGSGWYDLPNIGFSHWIMNLLRALCMSCVPLFLMLSGYLCSRRELSARYYLGLVRIYVLYLLSCAASLLVRILVLKEDIGPRAALDGILNHSANTQSWYVAMYTGLFLLIPFLNLAWQGLKTRRKRLVLVWTMIYLSALPSLLNLHPRLHLYLVWWSSLYPITYYWIGAYLHDHPPTRRPRLFRTILAVSLLGAATLNYCRSHPGPFAFDASNWYDGFETLLCSVPLFVLLLQLDLRRCPGWLGSAIRTLARLSFSIYLFSNAVDLAVYRLGARLIPKGGAWFFAYALCTAASLLLSLPLAWLAERLALPLIRGISGALGRLYRRLAPKGTEETHG